MTEIEALQKIMAAALAPSTAQPDADLDRAIRWLDRRISDIVDHGRVTIRLGMPAVIRS